MKFIKIMDKLPEKHVQVFCRNSKGRKDIWNFGNGLPIPEWIEEWLDESSTPVEEVAKALKDAIERMDRAREILRKDENSQWNMLDTTSLKETLAASLPSSSVTGEWQLCPKCNGEGILQIGKVIPDGRIDFTCEVCNGKKILAKPVTGESEAIGERKFTLKEALELWDDAQQIGIDVSSGKIRTTQPDKLTHFLKKFGINL